MQQEGNKSDNQIPAYCWLFTQKADEAYIGVNPSLETKAKLVELFRISLYIDEMVMEIF